MKNNQVKLLTSLAKKIEKEKKDRSQIISTLQSAKILTKKENFTEQYSNLRRVVVSK